MSVRSDATGPIKVMDDANVTAWQNEVDTLEQKQMQIQSDQMTLLFSQIHILTRELGDLQKQFVTFQATINDKVDKMGSDLTAAAEEAHSALRLELAEHGNNAEEMKAAWQEAHQALSDAMDTNLSELAEQHAKALEDHATSNAEQLKEQATTHGGNLEDLEALHNARYEDHAKCLEQGLEDVHSNLQKELAELKSGHAVNLQAIVTDLTAQMDKLTLDVEAMGKDLVAAQEEAHSALRLELAEHGNNAAEMSAAWKEAHDALAKSMDENLADMAEQHAEAHDKRSEGHNQRMNEMEAQIAAQFERLHSNHDALKDMHDTNRFAHAEALEKGMESVLENTHSRLQDELKELRSGHAANLKQILEDVTLQVDTLTLAMENAQVLRKANSTKLEQIFKDMSKAFSVNFSGVKEKKKSDNKDSQKATTTPASTAPAPSSRFAKK